jgi:hypothetical protein
MSTLKKLDPNKLTLGTKREVVKENKPDLSIESAVKQIHEPVFQQVEVKEETIRTTLDLPKSWHKKILMRAKVERGLTIKDYLLDLIKKDLEKQ